MRESMRSDEGTLKKKKRGGKNREINKNRKKTCFFFWGALFHHSWMLYIIVEFFSLQQVGKPRQGNHELHDRFCDEAT